MAEVAAPIFKKRGAKATNIRKRPATPPQEDSDASDGSDFTDDEAGVRVKRRKTAGVNTASTSTRAAQDLSKFSKYSADRSLNITANEDATRTSNWYEDASKSADAAVAMAKAKSQTEDQAQDNKGTYRGTSTYSNFIQKHTDAPSRQVGPQKAPTNVRTITVTDFAPDVCKDYKQTGFCGFGDSCKFLHAREDYKQGWQLDKEWEKAGKKEKPGQKGAGGKDTEGMDEEEKILENIPFKCIICKGDYKLPVVTKCGHYFCEKCAMTRYMKEKRKQCANCGADTAGSFGVAKKLKELLDKKRKRIDERKAEARERGEEVVSELED